MIKVIYEDNHLLVVEKPINIPTQKDDSNDIDLLTLGKNYLKEKYNKPGNVYLGLIHRLDRPVGGVIVFAKTSKAASRLSKDISNRKITKIYNALCTGNPKDNTWKDYLTKDKLTNISKIDPNGKEAILEFINLKNNNNMSLVEINLITGRSHQIRVQFSSHGYPLYGDQKYNNNAKNNEQIALWSSKIILNHPITKKEMIFNSSLPNTYPWNIFD